MCTFDTVACVAVSQSSENSMHGIPGGNRVWMVCFFPVCSVGTLTEMQVVCAGTELRHYPQEHSVLLLEVEPLFIFFYFFSTVVLEKMQGINLVRKKIPFSR